MRHQLLKEKVNCVLMGFGQVFARQDCKHRKVEFEQLGVGCDISFRASFNIRKFENAKLKKVKLYFSIYFINVKLNL